MEIVKTDVLVIGGGGAGMRAALAAKKEGSEVLLVSKTPMGKSTCTYLSAGAFTLAVEGMSKEMHRELTLQSGRGINDRELVEVFVENAPERVRELERFGVVGSWGKGHFSTEGKISAWGAPLTEALAKESRKQGVSERPWVAIFELLKEDGNIVGALGFEFRKGVPIAFMSRATILANGGGGALYPRHDNPVRTTGDGYALAFHAGCQLRDMEFIQFIPTGLAEPGKPTLLIAVSLPEVGKIVNSVGEDVLQKYGITDRPVALKSRDSFSQAVFKEEEEGKQVFLDLRALREEDWPKDNFAQSQKKLFFKFLSCSQKPVRLSPMCHFFIGGVSTDQNGRTGIPGLFAAGEVTGGLHGANRLGGNALGEIIVFGYRAGKTAGEWALGQGWGKNLQKFADAEWGSLQKRWKSTRKGLTPRSLRKSIAEILWKEGGISRDKRGLNLALEALRRIKEKDLPQASAGSPKEVLEKMEVENARAVGEMIVGSAIIRQESRGAHFRRDFPKIDDQNWKGNIFLQKAEDGMSFEFRPLAGKIL
ncbi:MAG TPA: FAD-binding protein [Thermodesulfobacteriota bacterium]|nr:FAD-binding protein [Thermodesulfobacteriota bacterium]